MNRYPLWRYLLIVFLIVFGVIYALPNIYGEDPAIQVSTQSGLTLATTVSPTRIRTSILRGWRCLKTV